jgi:hypothetical protein
MSLYEDALHLKPGAYKKLSAVLDEFVRGNALGSDQNLAP